MKDSKQLDSPIRDVEELIDTLGNHQSSEVRELRQRVRDAVDSSRKSEECHRRIRRYAASVDRYITCYRGLGFSTASSWGAVLSTRPGYSVRKIEMLT